MKKEKFINEVSKIDQTTEDEFKAEYNSPELLWEFIKKNSTKKHLYRSVFFFILSGFLFGLWAGIKMYPGYKTYRQYEDTLIEKNIVIKELINQIHEEKQYSEKISILYGYQCRLDSSLWANQEKIEKPIKK